MDFTLPELGENVTTGDVLRVLVKVGDDIKKDQGVVELETDKATIEVPSSVEGKVTDIKVKAGDQVKVGQVILSVDEGQVGQERPRPERGAESPSESARGPASTNEGQVGQVSQAGQVGQAGKSEPTEQEPAEKHAEPPPRREKIVDFNRAARVAPQAAAEPATDLPLAPASPSVRRMARELGIDVNNVQGTGTSGRISVDDVKASAKRLVMASASGGTAAAEPLPDFSRWGEVERQPLRGVRKKTAEHLSAAWAAVVHVTQHEVADVTSLDELRKQFGKQVQAAGGNLTMTAIAVKIAAAALKIFPQFNASLDLAAGEIVLKKYVNIGVAVDTDRGLLVPVIKNADTKNITDISVELVQLSEKARSKKIGLDEMQGGTFSISNLGGIGGTFFTPIVNLPEVAILGISRAKMEPVFVKETGQFAPRLMLPLSLSYDHRVIDGADAIRFLRWVAETLEQPFLLELQG